jgi:MFS family permease
VSFPRVPVRLILERRIRCNGKGCRTEERLRMGLSYRWVIVGAGALMTCVGIGAMFSLAVYLQPMSAETGWSRAGISSAMTIDFLTMGLAGFGWGAASDKFGTRPVVLSGAVLLGLGLFLASRATSLLQFQLTYGIVVGAAAGAFFAPMIAAATQWFETTAVWRSHWSPRAWALRR